MNAGLDEPRGAIRSGGDRVRLRLRSRRRWPLDDATGRGIEPAEKAAREVGVVDRAVGRGREPAWARIAVGKDELANGQARRIEPAELVRPEFAEVERPVVCARDPVRLGVGRRNVDERDLAGRRIELPDEV